MSRLIVLCFLVMICPRVNAQYINVLIGDLNNPEEPSIMIDPKNTDHMVAGANIDNYYYSIDGGLTWQSGSINTSYGVWGDDVIQIDTNSNFLYFHLSNPPFPGNWIDRIVCQVSSDGGQTWNDGSYMGLNGAKVQDKPWAFVDRTTNTIYVTWTQFDNYGSFNPADSSIILFSKSTDGGQTWSSPRRINKIAGDCLDSDNTVEGAVPAAGPEGEVYVSWAGPLGLVFSKSLDQGETWPDTNIFVSDIQGGWDFAISGIYRANGLPVTCCDLSNGPYRGNIYINWADQRNGPTDTDIWFVKSTDGGSTWSTAKRVNNDPVGHQQFFSWMTVDQVTGKIYIVFYDRRNYLDNMTDVYLAISNDAGETFQNIKISNSPFNPYSQVFFGDYTCISAHNNIVRPIWTRLDSYDLSVWTAIIDSVYTSIGVKAQTSVPVTFDQNYPNPFRDYTIIAYKVHSPVTITLKIHDVLGREITTIFNHKPVTPGKYIERFDASAYHLAPGFYYCSLEYGDQSIKRKMIAE